MSDNARGTKVRQLLSVARQMGTLDKNTTEYHFLSAQATRLRADIARLDGAGSEMFTVVGRVDVRR